MRMRAVGMGPGVTNLRFVGAFGLAKIVLGHNKADRGNPTCARSGTGGCVTPAYSKSSELPQGCSDS